VKTVKSEALKLDILPFFANQLACGALGKIIYKVIEIIVFFIKGITESKK